MTTEEHVTIRDVTLKSLWRKWKTAREELIESRMKKEGRWIDLGAATRKSLEPWIKDEVVYYQHQIEGVRKLIRQKSFILADDMGLGKSLQALTVFAADIVMGLSSTAIVVAPVTLKQNWSNEIEKFSRIPHVVLEGSRPKREKQILEFASIHGPKILIVNYEQVVSHLNTLNSLNFDVAIFDEAHYLRNPKARRTEASLNLRSTRSFMLSGTPFLNHVNELWSLLHKIDPEAYPKYYSFVNRYAVFGGYSSKQIVGVKNERELKSRLGNLMLRRLKEEVLDLPEVQFIQRIVKLLPQQEELYKQIVNEGKLSRFDSEEDDEIENALTKYLRLKQICGTTFRFTNQDHSAKLDLAVEDDLEILKNGHRVVVFTQFRDVLECYVKRMSNHDYPIFQLHGQVPKEDRVNTVTEWSQTEKPGVLVCMLQVAGIGLNMTAARHASFLDKLWVPGLNKQAVDRLNRIGASTTQPIQVREYLVKGSVETRVEAILKNKSEVFADVVEGSVAWRKILFRELMAND